MKLKNYLKDYLAEDDMASLVTSFDVVGDIAIIIVPDELVAHEKRIAESVLVSNRKIQVVAKRAGNYGGEFRTVPLEILAGEERKETEVKEFGIRLSLNAESVYYSVRSGNERRRIASLVEYNESVMVFFSGVAPFPLVISKFSGARSIVGIEKNPIAHHYGTCNLRLNKNLNNIRLFLGDAEEIASTLSPVFDRVIMPLPTLAEKFLPSALKILKPGGWLHFYDLQRSHQFDESIEKILSVCESHNRGVESTAVTRCGHTAPHTFRICVDARIE